MSQQAKQEMLPFWTQKQQELHLNTYNITPAQTIDQALIFNKTIAAKLNNQTDEAVAIQAEQNILNLTNNDPNATDYVLKQLNYKDMAGI